jgi:hypothetical protein
MVSIAVVIKIIIMTGIEATTTEAITDKTIKIRHPLVQVPVKEIRWPHPQPNQPVSFTTEATKLTITITVISAVEAASVAKVTTIEREIETETGPTIARTTIL